MSSLVLFGNISLKLNRRTQLLDRLVSAKFVINYANNRYSAPWRLLGQMLPVQTDQQPSEDSPVSGDTENQDEPGVT